MVNENLKAIVENKKSVEEVREIENEIPSFEEFMKTYENDGNLNYADLNGGSIGEVKGYGPTIDWWEEGTNSSGHYYIACGQRVRTDTRSFYLKVECYNWGGGGGYDYVCSTSEALQYARRLENGIYSNVSSETEQACADLVREAVRHYDRGHSIDGYVKAKSKFWGGCERSHRY